VHELPITEEILNISLKHAQKNGAKRIVRINLVIGDLTDLIDEWVQRYFEYLAKDSIAEKATLVIERVPITVLCEKCRKPFVVDKKEMDFHCPDCGEKGTELLRGREFTVKSIEIE
jgi:hydrogenase nickel incorporation protein HypA/HybF